MTDEAEQSIPSRGSHRPDIVSRLRRWVHSVDAVSASDLMDEAADEIESLNAEVVSMLEVCRFERETSERYASFLRLTAEEREAVEWSAQMAGNNVYFKECDTLRALLARLK
jgi:hypothetical protein